MKAKGTNGFLPVNKAVIDDIWGAGQREKETFVSATEKLIQKEKQKELAAKITAKKQDYLDNYSVNPCAEFLTDDPKSTPVNLTGLSNGIHPTMRHTLDNWGGIGGKVSGYQGKKSTLDVDELQEFIKKMREQDSKEKPSRREVSLDEFLRLLKACQLVFDVNVLFDDRPEELSLRITLHDGASFRLQHEQASNMIDVNHIIGEYKPEGAKRLVVTYAQKEVFNYE